MSGRHRKPTTSAISVAKIAFTDAVIGGSGIALAGQAGAATDGEWDRVASRESGGNRAINTDDEEKEVKYEHVKAHCRSSDFGPAHAGIRTAVAYADQPANKGQGGATEDKSTGARRPQRVRHRQLPARHQRTAASATTPPGSHLARKTDAEPAQRLGVGNVSRTDGELSTDPGDNTGDRPGDHGASSMSVPDDNEATDPTAIRATQNRSDPFSPPADILGGRVLCPPVQLIHVGSPDTDRPEDT